MEQKLANSRRYQRDKCLRQEHFLSSTASSTPTSSTPVSSTPVSSAAGIGTYRGRSNKTRPRRRTSRGEPKDRRGSARSRRHVTESPHEMPTFNLEWSPSERPTDAYEPEPLLTQTEEEDNTPSETRRKSKFQQGKKVFFGPPSAGARDPLNWSRGVWQYPCTLAQGYVLATEGQSVGSSKVVYCIFGHPLNC